MVTMGTAGPTPIPGQNAPTNRHMLSEFIFSCQKG